MSHDPYHSILNTSFSWQNVSLHLPGNVSTICKWIMFKRYLWNSLQWSKWEIDHGPCPIVWHWGIFAGDHFVPSQTKWLASQGIYLEIDLSHSRYTNLQPQNKIAGLLPDWTGFFNWFCKVSNFHCLPSRSTLSCMLCPLSMSDK